jgi:hypothetical protein
MKQGIIGFFKFIFMLSAFIAAANSIFNTVSPWEGDSTAKKHTHGYLSLAVGGSSLGSAITSRSYALIPISISAPKMLFVSKSGAGEFSIETDQFAFWLFGSVIIYGWYLIIKLIQKMVRTQRLQGGGATKT